MSNITQTLGKLERVPLRDVWINEASDFTPWLAEAENLNLLAEALELDEIEKVDSEYEVGDFRIDILCEDRSGKIIIENQLEKTDHKHLGQIMTYAAGVDAKKVIWIAESFRPEHVAAIDFLNENTTEDLNFFAVEVQLWKIGNSDPAPKFVLVARPNQWTKRSREETRAATIESPTKRKQLEFWTAFSDFLKQRAPHIKTQTPSPKLWFETYLGRANFKLNPTINTRNDRLGVELFITGTQAKQHFAKLYNLKDEIESKLGFTLDWQDLPDAKSTRIATWHPQAPIDQRERWQEYMEWLAQRLIAMHDTLKPIVRSLPSREEEAEPET
ncbi:MAG: DUF4268 domain-containing protein [Burkholderiaceae bacterium]|nr:DUF4268 domain-containing protein [Burkholderiaceae bacterium]